MNQNFQRLKISRINSDHQVYRFERIMFQVANINGFFPINSIIPPNSLTDLSQQLYRTPSVKTTAYGWAMVTNNNIRVSFPCTELSTWDEFSRDFSYSNIMSFILIAYNFSTELYIIIFCSYAHISLSTSNMEHSRTFHSVNLFLLVLCLFKKKNILRLFFASIHIHYSTYNFFFSLSQIFYCILRFACLNLLPSRQAVIA
jgi:hypothetical protein